MQPRLCSGHPYQLPHPGLPERAAMMPAPKQFHSGCFGCLEWDTALHTWLQEFLDQDEPGAASSADMHTR